MRDAHPHVVVTLPVYKDSQFLKETCNVLEQATADLIEDFTLLIAEDGSNSSSVVQQLGRRYENIIYTQHDRRLGRGKALREAWKKVDGDIYVYLDVDLATDLTEFNAYENLIREQERFDLVTGSRYIAGAKTSRPLLRRAASIGYNYLIRLMFQTGVHDHQCGFKSFSSKLVQFLAAEARSDTWFWDTEVIVLAKKSGFRIKEIPVSWVEKKGSRTPIRRLIKDMWLHGTGLLTLFHRTYFS